VLPFENRSEEKGNAYFADGVQGEVLTDLAKVADLKVISRTSVMQYRSGPQSNVRQIGQELGVAHVVEGSVQRSGNRVRVNVQLVDARTDRQLWAQTYDRDLADVFAIQSEMQRQLPPSLMQKLSPNEEVKFCVPDERHHAFDLYTRARQFFSTPSYNVSSKRICWRRSICSTSQSRVIHRFSEHIANSPLFMTRFISMVTTIHRRVWPGRSSDSSGLWPQSGCRRTAPRACVESLLGIPRLRRWFG